MDSWPYCSDFAGSTPGWGVPKSPYKLLELFYSKITSLKKNWRGDAGDKDTDDEKARVWGLHHCMPFFCNINNKSTIVAHPHECSCCGMNHFRRGSICESPLHSGNWSETIIFLPLIEKSA